METVQKRYYTQSEVDYLTPNEEAEWAAMVLIGKIEEMPRPRGHTRWWIVNPGGYTFTCRQNALEYSQTERTRYFSRYRQDGRDWEDSGEIQSV